MHRCAYWWNLTCSDADCCVSSYGAFLLTVARSIPTSLLLATVGVVYHTRLSMVIDDLLLQPVVGGRGLFSTWVVCASCRTHIFVYPLCLSDCMRGFSVFPLASPSMWCVRACWYCRFQVEITTACSVHQQVQRKSSGASSNLLFRACLHSLTVHALSCDSMLQGPDQKDTQLISAPFEEFTSPSTTCNDYYYSSALLIIIDKLMILIVMYLPCFGQHWLYLGMFCLVTWSVAMLNGSWQRH